MLPIALLRRPGAIAVVFVSLVAFVAGCGSDSAKSPAAAGTPSSPGSLAINSFMFSPNPLAAKTGDTITVTNNDGTDHQVIADDKSFDTGPFSNGTKTFMVTKSGKVPYHCEIHSYMTGVIQVTAA